MADLDRDEQAAPTEADVDAKIDSGEDKFYRGLIVSLDKARARGVIRSNSGREIVFQFPFVSVIGAAICKRAPGIEQLRQGDEVGFDVGWTSKGLRVSVIKPAR